MQTSIIRVDVPATHTLPACSLHVERAGDDYIVSATAGVLATTGAAQRVFRTLLGAMHCTHTEWSLRTLH